MSNKITLKQFTGKSKKTGEEFKCFQLIAGSFSTLIFPRSKIEYEYLENYLNKSAHEDFQDDGDALFD